MGMGPLGAENQGGNYIIQLGTPRNYGKIPFLEPLQLGRNRWGFYNTQLLGMQLWAISHKLNHYMADVITRITRFIHIVGGQLHPK